MHFLFVKIPKFNYTKETETLLEYKTYFRVKTHSTHFSLILGKFPELLHFNLLRGNKKVKICKTFIDLT